MQQRHRKFRYAPVRREKQFRARFGLPPLKRPKKVKPIPGTLELLRLLSWQAAYRQQVDRMDGEIDRFMEHRPRLLREYNAFADHAAHQKYADTKAMHQALKEWLLRAAHHPNAIIRREGHLALVVDNTAPRSPHPLAGAGGDAA